MSNKEIDITDILSCEPTKGMRELFPEEHGNDDDDYEEEKTEQA